MTFVLKFVLQFLVSRVMFPPNLKFPHLSDSEKIEGTRDWQIVKSDAAHSASCEGRTTIVIQCIDLISGNFWVQIT